MRDLAGLMLVSSAVWKEISLRKEKIVDISENEVIALLIQNGLKVGYDFEKLIKTTVDPETVSRLERIYFEHKYIYKLYIYYVKNTILRM